MASAHGAGLMFVPVLLELARQPYPADNHGAHTAHMALANQDLLAGGLHTLAMFTIMALIALVVYQKLGLAVLRQGWVNLDRVWAFALLTAGGFTLLL